MKSIFRSVAKVMVSLVLLPFCVEVSYALEKSDKIRVYVMNCGYMELKDMSLFSDTGEYDGKQGNLEDPCFLIQHPQGLLLWDTGLGDDLVGKSAEVSGPFQFSVSISLDSQLRKLGVTQKEITYIAFSHTHHDHTGNANQFVASTWLWQEKELEHSHSKVVPRGVKPESFKQSSKAKKIILKGDYDVFGDGQVKILSTPGHTPGHQCLLVKLSGQPVILSGDLYHLRESRKHQRVPVVNYNRAETLASMNRIETIAKNLGARVIVQHDPDEFASLPKFPEYLE